MDSGLRPMSNSQLLDRTFQIYLRHFALFAGIAMPAAALNLIATLAFGVLTAHGAVDPKNAGVGDTLLRFILLPVQTISQALAAGATIYAISAVHLGRTVSIAEAWSSLMRSFPSVLWAEVLINVRAYALIGGGMAFAAMGTATGGLALAIPGFLTVLVGVGVAIWVLLMYSLAVPACVVEGLPGKQSLTRSRFLTSGAVGRVFLIGFLAGMVALALNYVLQAPVSISGSFGYRLPHWFPAQHWDEISEFLSTILSGPVATIAIALLYYDQRVRKEALDIQLMMQSVTADLKTAAV